MFAGWLPPAWLLGTGLLGISKIVENMELGHNVMHGQFDWLNDPALNGAQYDWDTIATGDDWKYTHNYIHHTYTNIVGMDHDVGYGLIRVSESQPWEPRFLFNIPLAAQLICCLNGMSAFRICTWKMFSPIKPELARCVEGISQSSHENEAPSAERLCVSIIAGPNAIPVFTGNGAANVIRSLWASAVIFNGHFTEDAETFEMDNTEHESRAEWYLRQIRGSSNFPAPHEICIF